jgi:hypothetical protein
MVRSQIIKASGEPVKVDYMMRVEMGELRQRTVGNFRRHDAFANSATGIR